jgi:hypothetical protein
MSKLSQETLNYLVKIRGIYNQYAQAEASFDAVIGTYRMPAPNMHPALRPELPLHDAVIKHAETFVELFSNNPMLSSKKYRLATDMLYKHLNSESAYVNRYGGEPHFSQYVGEDRLTDSNKVIAVLAVCHIWFSEMYRKGFRTLTDKAAAEIASNGTLVKIERFVCPFEMWDAVHYDRHIRRAVILENPKQVEIDGTTRTCYEIDAINARAQYYSVTILPVLLEDTNSEYKWLYRVSKSKAK